MGSDNGIICEATKSILIIGKVRDLWARACSEDDMLGLAMENPRIAKWVDEMTSGEVEVIYAESGGAWDDTPDREAHPDWRCFSIWEGWEELGYEYWPIDDD